MPKGTFRNLINKRFPGTRLTPIKRLPNDDNGRVVWMCICTCGNYKATTTQHLHQGDTKSCGCLHAELSAARLREMHRRWKLEKEHGEGQHRTRSRTSKITTRKGRGR